MGPTLLNESPLKITSAAAAGTTPWTATAGGPLTPDPTWWSGLFQVNIAGNVLFCNIFFSTSHVILLSLHHQSSCYSCIHIFNTLHLLVTVIHVGSPCVLTFAATNLSHGSTEPGNVNYRLFKVHVHHKYMGPKLFFGTPMNSNTPPPLYNPPWLSSYTAPHILSWKEEHIMVSVHKLWFLPFLEPQQWAGSLGLTTL